MYRKTKKLFAVALVVSMILTMGLFGTTASAAATSNRLEGGDRYATALNIVGAGWTSSEYAVLATGEGYADALAAAPLAKAYNAPILLVDPTTDNAAVKAKLTALGVTKVFIVGGEGVVSKAFADSLTATVTRLGGLNRVETSVKVATQLVAKVGTITEIAVANEDSYADALSMAPIAANKNMPILLTSANSLPAEVSTFLAGKAIAKTYVLGGTGVVSEDVKALLPGAVRLGGANRYATNLAVLSNFADLNFANVVVAAGENYPDALAGSAYAAKLNAPMVLVDGTVDSATLAYVAGKATPATKVVALGGAAVVSDAAVAGLVAAINNSTFQVTEVKAISATQVLVKFNKEVNEADAEDITALTGNYAIGSAVISGAELQADKVTVLLTLAAPLTGTNLYVIQPVALAADTTVKTPIFTFVETYSDTVAPSVVKVVYPTFDKVEVTFSEPIKGLGNVTITQDGNSFSLTPSWNTAKTVATYDLSTLVVDKPITLAIVGAIDEANNLVNPNPLTLTLSKVKADTTKPAVAEVKALSNKRISITFSEKLSVAPVTVSANSQTVTLSTTDNITYTGVMAAAASGIGKVIVSGDYKDMSGNTGDAYTSGLLQFTADTTAPKLVGSEVKTFDSKPYLVLHFDEDVNVVGGAISGTRVKDYVSYSFSVATPSVLAYTKANKADVDDAKSVMVDISNNTTYPAGVYSVTVPTGFVNDTAVPTAKDSVAATVSFTKVITTNDTDKPTVNALPTFSTDNKYMDVVYSESMDPATALNIYNYKVGGRVIFSGATFAENDRTVRLTVVPGSIVYSGNYNVYITGVKDKAGNSMAEDYSETLAVVENVAPYVASAKLTAGNTIEVTMSEDVVGVNANADFTVIVDSKELVATTEYTLSETSAGKVTITLTTAITDLSKVIQVKLVDTAVTDNANTTIKNPATTGVLVTVTH